MGDAVGSKGEDIRDEKILSFRWKEYILLTLQTWKFCRSKRFAFGAWEAAHSPLWAMQQVAKVKMLAMRKF